jgi:DNA repair exonuclease SbcCD nuclease subunit
LKEAGVKCYVIAGSHDYSVSGKTFLDVLEKAGLLENVENIDSDNLILTEEKDFVIAGISGKKQELEKELIKRIKIPKLGNKFKILALHTTLEENKTSDFVEGLKSSELPKGFDYYALGHIHKPYKSDEKIVYPGPLFPNNFGELEELRNGGFFIVNVDGKKLSFEREEIKLKEILALDFNADGKNPFLLTSEIIGAIKKENINDKIILMRVEGALASGKTSEVDFEAVKKGCEKSFVLLKNVSKLKSPETKIEAEIKSENAEEIEKLVLEKLNADFRGIAPQLLKALEIEKMEGDTLMTFEKRLMDNLKNVVELE